MEAYNTQQVRKDEENDAPISEEDSFDASRRKEGDAKQNSSGVDKGNIRGSEEVPSGNKSAECDENNSESVDSQGIETYQEYYQGKVFPCPYCSSETERELDSDGKHYICVVCGQKFFDLIPECLRKIKDVDINDEYLVTDEKIKNWKEICQAGIDDNRAIKCNENALGIMILPIKSNKKSRISSESCGRIKTIIVPYGVKKLSKDFWPQMTSLENIVFQSKDGKFSYRKSKIANENSNIKIYGKTRSGEEIGIEDENNAPVIEKQPSFKERMKNIVNTICKMFTHKKQSASSDSSSLEVIEGSVKDTIKLDQESVNAITERLRTILQSDIAEVKEGIDNIHSLIEKFNKEMTEKLTATAKPISSNRLLSKELEYYKKLFEKAILGEEYGDQQLNNFRREFERAIYSYDTLCDIKKIYLKIEEKEIDDSFRGEINKLRNTLIRYEEIIGEKL